MKKKKILLLVSENIPNLVSIFQHILVSEGMRQTGYCWLPFLIQLLLDIHKDVFLCLFPCSTWKLSVQRSMGTTRGSVWLCADAWYEAGPWLFSISTTFLSILPVFLNLILLKYFFFPAVCTNMCWGIYCTFGNNDSKATLTYDDPDKLRQLSHESTQG